MTMSAKYPGVCNKCGQKINIGDKINWVPGKGATHIKCPEVAEVATVAENSIRIFEGQGYGGSQYQAGQILRNPQNIAQILYVIKATKEYFAYDGLSFGVGDERGYVYMAECREATAKESEPLIAIEAERTAKKVKETRREEIKEQIQNDGERPDGINVPEGDIFSNRQDIYGGGDWFIVGNEFIWYCQNNGMDGDNWSYNNIRTGGAGAIGWKIPFNAVLSEEIKTFNTIQDKSHSRNRS